MKSAGGGTHFEGGADAESITEAQCEAHKQQAIAQLVRDMGDPDSVIALWQQCVDNPLMFRSLANIISFTGKWTGNGTTLTLSWEITGAVSATLEVDTLFAAFHQFGPDFDQALTVELNGTRDFVIDMDSFAGATLTCTDVHGLWGSTSPIIQLVA